MTDRVGALDIFRGLTIIMMVLVLYPGSQRTVYTALRHSEWHGWTLADSVFPFFLFIVGASLVVSFSKRIQAGEPRQRLIKKVIKRAVILFGLGLLLNLTTYLVIMLRPEYGYPAHFRVMGILQRIAICYLLASLFFIYLRTRGLYCWLVGLLLGYWFLMILIPVPGYGAGDLASATSSLASYVDRLVFGPSLWYGKNFDPEGLLSTLPAIATTLLGVVSGKLLLSDQKKLFKVVLLVIIGSLLVVLGLAWHQVFPINKTLWTSSYAVLTAGQAMVVLGLCYWVIDVKGWKRWTRPLVIFGINALVIFFLGEVLYHLLLFIKVTPAGTESLSLYSFIFLYGLKPLFPPYLASLLFAVAWVLLWYGVVLLLYRRNRIIKV